MISVIIPTYSPSNYIEECLESLEKQTLDKSQYEVIVILNGQREPYYDYLETILKKSSFRFRLVYTSKKGVSNARNIGLSIAMGDSICFIDDDDIVSSNYLLSLSKLVMPNSIVVSNLLVFSDDKKICREDYVSKAFKQNCDLSSLFFNRKFFSSSCAKIIPREVLKDTYFDTTISLGEDSLFMATISCNVKKVIRSDEDVIYYRRERNLSASRGRYPKSFVRRNKMTLIGKYIKLYINKIKDMNFLFFISRIVATIKN